MGKTVISKDTETQTQRVRVVDKDLDEAGKSWLSLGVILDLFAIIFAIYPGTGIAGDFKPVLKSTDLDTTKLRLAVVIVPFLTFVTVIAWLKIRGDHRGTHKLTAEYFLIIGLAQFAVAVLIAVSFGQSGWRGIAGDKDPKDQWRYNKWGYPQPKNNDNARRGLLACWMITDVFSFLTGYCFAYGSIKLLRATSTTTEPIARRWGH